MTHDSRAPVIVVGTGLAGLATALHLADTRPVLLLSKAAATESATAWAQGGIVGVVGPDDSVDAHVQDTLVAGAGLVDERSARFVSSRSREALAWLLAQGVPFSRDPSGPMGLHLTREGGHGVRRIAHAADATGHAIHQTLLARVRAHAGIVLRERAMAVDLLAHGRRCLGLRVLDLDSGRIDDRPAPAVVLATGGLGQLYRHTSNPSTATGDGIALAWRAGCRVAELAFIQFHPTCLAHPQERSFLVTEALRGEGARLVLPDGTRFMPAHDIRAELAPRDIVARAIAAEMRRHGLPHVGLDATALGEGFLREHFPTIHARCRALGIDIAREAIPVVPAAHYACGGVVTDLAGRTDVDGLYAVGETACTGLHGANRLASNSLLECVVLARSCAAHIAGRPAGSSSAPSASAIDLPTGDSPSRGLLDELQGLMSAHVGIVRSHAGLAQAASRIDAMRQAFRPTRHPAALELRNLLDCAALVVQSARMRPENRGAHWNEDLQPAGPSTRSE